MILATALIATACLLLGYTLGENRIIQNRMDSGSLTSQLEREQQRAAELEAQLIDVQLASDVHKNAANELRDELQGLYQQVAALGEEVTFYKSLMAPEDIRQGLQVDGLEISPAEADRYHFQLLLTQVALRRTYIGGEVRLDIVGREGSTQVVKSLTELDFQETYPLKFKFRYFQDLSGTFVLGEDFVPEKVLITAKQSGKDELQVSFPWLSEGRS